MSETRHASDYAPLILTAGALAFLLFGRADTSGGDGGGAAGASGNPTNAAISVDYVPVPNNPFTADANATPVALDYAPGTAPPLTPMQQVAFSPYTLKNDPAGIPSGPIPHAPGVSPLLSLIDQNSQHIYGGPAGPTRDTIGPTHPPPAAPVYHGGDVVTVDGHRYGRV